MITSRVALIAASALATLSIAAPVGHAATVDRCVTGQDVAGLEGFDTAAATAAEDAYAATLKGQDEATVTRARKVFAAGLAAYVYGMPQVTIRETIKKYPPNTLINVAKLANAQTRSVVAPNSDTAYSVENIDLSRGPIVFDVPDMGNRYYVFEFLDAYSNAFGYIGRRATGSKAGSYALVGPGWQGTLPAGVGRITSPTNTVFLIARTLVDGPADMPAVKALQQQFHATPLSAWTMGARQPSVTLDDFPPQATGPVVVPTGTAFIAALNRSLAVDPAPAKDACAVKAMAPAGVSPGGNATMAGAVAAAPGPAPAGSESDPVTSAAVKAATAAADKLVDAGVAKLGAASAKTNSGWLRFDSWIGRYDDRYLGRSIVAKIGLGANIPEEATYPVALSDRDGQELTGTNDYTITYPAGQEPPAAGFWSLTMYAADYFFYDNKINRYNVGDRTRGLVRDADGSLTIYISHTEPTDPVKRANWLPAPAGPFRMILRIFQPKATVIDGTWKLTPIVRVGSGAASTAGGRPRPAAAKPRLLVDYKRGRDGRGRVCARGGVRLRLTRIRDGQARSVSFFLGGRRVGVDRRAPFARSLPASKLAGRSTHRVTARVLLRTGRTVTVSRLVRSCR